MTDFKNTPELSESTEPAIAYSTCYRLPFLSLFHADCMEIMKQYPDKYFDLAIVDPPYGIDYSRNDGLIKQGKVKRQNGTYGFINRKQHSKKDWDKETPKQDYFKELFRVSKNQIIWGANYFELPPTKGIICWDKKQMLPTFSRWEYAWSSFNATAKMFEFDNRGFLSGEENIHPTQKPSKLYEFLFKNYSNENAKILDTHFGSGSIALAVDKANRLDKMNLHLTACEIDKEYIDKAIKRISESIKQGTLSF